METSVGCISEDEAKVATTGVEDFTLFNESFHESSDYYVNDEKSEIKTENICGDFAKDEKSEIRTENVCGDYVNNKKLEIKKENVCGGYANDDKSEIKNENVCVSVCNPTEDYTVETDYKQCDDILDKINTNEEE